MLPEERPSSQELIDTHIYEISGSELCKKPMVSVVVFTFNHKEFIRKSIESILDQKTSFLYEIIIGDDCSTDGTTDIVRKYQGLYPDKFRLLIADRNLWNPLPGLIGLTPLAALKAPRGKYIALQHGDDYWTDSFKLQKQVDFLEANHDFSICFHKVKIFENGQLKDDDITQVPSKESTILDLACLGNYIHTTSCVFRNHGIKIFGSHFQESPVGDYYLHMINAQYGKIYHIEEVMAVYRLHDTSSWSSQDQFYRERQFQLARMAVLKDLLPTSSEASQKLAEAYLRNSLSLKSQFDYDDCMAEVVNYPSYFPRHLLINSLNETQKKLTDIGKELQRINQRSVFQHIKEKIKKKIENIGFKINK